MERTSALLRKKYNSLLVSTLAMTASLYLSGILDGIMVGRILSPLAFSAINLTLCISFLENILVALFTYGGNTLAVIYKGKRENENADAVFTLSFAAGLISAVIIAIAGLLLIKPTASLLGQNNSELESLIRAYLVPLWILTPFTSIINITAAFSRTDGLKKLSTSMPIIANVINLICDYTYMAILHKGIAGAGWATVTGYALTSLLFIVYLKSDSRTVFFTKQAFKHLAELKKIFSTGLPSSLIYVCNFLRLFFTNAIILSSTGTAGVQIASVSFSLNSLCFIFVEGASMTLLPLLGALYGENDIKGIRLSLKYGLYVTTLLCIIVMALSMLFPVQLASLYGLTNPEILSVFKTTFRIVSLNVPILGLIYVMRTFFQATKQKAIANFLVVVDGFAAVVPIMWAFSKINIYWLWASFPVSKMLTVILTIVAVIICKKIQNKSNYLLLDEHKGAVFDFTIENKVEAAIEASQKAIEFCKESAVDENTATLVGVAIEELCVNTARYAYSPQCKNIDVFLKISKDNIIIRLRDNGKIFNPTEYMDDSGKIITGLQMLRSISSSIEYSRVIGYNTTLVTINTK